MLAGGFRSGRGTARFKKVVIGGLVVGRLRADIADSEDGRSVHLYKVASVSRNMLQRRRAG